ncbi:MAG: hypothetical protein ACRDHM_01205 [Actinomycetota bacterium]
MPTRLIAPLLALLAAGLLVTAALLPEIVVEPGGGGGLRPLDPERPAWVATLVGILVQVGLVLVAALMLLLRQSEAVAGGILLGAGTLGLTVRAVRFAQLGDSSPLAAGVGSWVDALAEAAVLAAGVVALSSLRRKGPEPEAEPQSALAPPPGEPPFSPDQG